MKVSARTRVAICSVAAAALLAGCGGSAAGALDLLAGAVPSTLTHHRTFRYTGKAQAFRVPAGVTSIAIVALGAAGQPSYRAASGRGGRVYAVIPVTPGETLRIFVGGGGFASYQYGDGGFNGGGNGGGFYEHGYGGGGATDVREGGNRLTDRILVAGGGGGAGGGDGGNGGAGGGSIAGAGSGVSGSNGGGGGGGGTQLAGGAGGKAGRGAYPKRSHGYPGKRGKIAVGGTGGNGGYGLGSSSDGLGGGGGGGGYYGGGGGGGGFGGECGCSGGGGGGGSSYIEPSAKKFRSWQGWKDATGNGLAVISW